MSKERQRIKFTSLEHAIRDVLEEGIGVGGTDKFQGNPSGFDARYSSRKGKHAAPPSMGAQRNASLTKISQTGGPMRAEGGASLNFGNAPSSAELSARGAPQESGKAPKKINEKVSDDKDEQKKDKGNSNLDLIKKSLVKHEPFVAQMTNPEGRIHPPIAPPMPQMNIPPSPQQQAMQPRQAPLPSTTPGAVATPQTARAEGGKSNGSGGSASAVPGMQAGALHPAHPAHAAPHLSAAASMVQNLAQLLHHQSQTAAAIPPQPESGVDTNPAPAVNEPQSTDKKNWRDQPGRRSGQTQSQIPGMIQRDPGTHGPDNSGGTHTNPGEKQKGSVGNLLGLPLKPDSPGMPSFQPPESQVDPKMFKRPNTPGGPKIDEKTPGMPSFQPPDAITPPSFSKGPTGKAAAAPTSDYQTPAGPPPTGGKMGQMAKEKAPEKKDEKAPQKEPEKKDEKAPEKKGRWRHAFDALTGKETPAERDQYNKERDAEDKAAKEKSSFAIPKGEPPKQGQPGTQSGPAPEKKNWRDEPGRRTGRNPEEDPESIHRDKEPVQGGPGHTNPGEKEKGGKLPIGGTLGIGPEKTPQHSPYQEPAGAPPTGGKLSKMTLGPKGEDPEGMDAAYQKFKKQDDPEKKKIYDDPNKGAWQKYKEGWKLSKQRQDAQYEKEHPGQKAPGGQWGNPDPIEKYGKTAGLIAGLAAAHWAAEHLKNLFGGGSGGGGSGGGSEKDRKAGYAPVHVHHDPAWSIPTGQTMRMHRRMYMPRGQQNEETEHDNTKERRKVSFIERQHKDGDGTKERRKVPYLERKPKKHDLRHRFSSKTLQGRETIAGMDEERMNTIMREAIIDAKAKRKKTEGGYNKTPVDTKPKLNPEPLDSLRGP